MSLNTVAVRVGLEVGPKNVVRTAHRLGISSKLEPNASIALGTSEVSMIELVGAYAPFANGGLVASPHVVTRIKTLDGKLLYARQPEQSSQVIEPRNVAMMNRMMEETLISGTARKAEIPGWTAAGKTGTSQDFRDAWFIGYTANLVTGVWLGNDDNSPTKKATGGGLPVEVWTRFMKAAHQGVPVAALPNSQAPGLLANLTQVASQVTAPSAQAPVPLPVGGPNRVAPTRSSVRPEASAGLDGWLMERLFGRREIFSCRAPLRFPAAGWVATGRLVSDADAAEVGDFSACGRSFKSNAALACDARLLNRVHLLDRQREI